MDTLHNLLFLIKCIYCGKLYKMFLFVVHEESFMKDVCFFLSSVYCMMSWSYCFTCWNNVMSVIYYIYQCFQLNSAWRLDFNSLCCMIDGCIEFCCPLVVNVCFSRRFWCWMCFKWFPVFIVIHYYYFFNYLYFFK